MEARALSGLGNVRRKQGRHEEAKQSYVAACQVFADLQSGLSLGTGDWVSIFDLHQSVYLSLQECCLELDDLVGAAPSAITV